jgi:hypothetical protein
MKKIEVKSLLIGTLLGAAVMFSIAAATRSGGRTAWEYKIVSGNAIQEVLGKAINSSVGEGWDFVSASAPNSNNEAFVVLRREKN